ncbi:MAG: hypothetical protein WCH60_03940 [Burkholderiales bacterium]
MDIIASKSFSALFIIALRYRTWLSLNRFLTSIGHCRLGRGLQKHRTDCNQDDARLSLSGVHKNVAQAVRTQLQCVARG